VFDQFYASQVASLAKNPESEQLMQAAGSALLDRIGPAVLLTHSQAGLFGWLIADARPGLVKAIQGLSRQRPYGDAGTEQSRHRRLCGRLADCQNSVGTWPPAHVIWAVQRWSKK
jgi:hypothetical protein